jgi:hypothetical protein
LLLSSVFSVAARGRGNSACAQFCATMFDNIDDRAGQCTRAAAHHQAASLCSVCGPAAPSGHPYLARLARLARCVALRVRKSVAVTPSAAHSDVTAGHAHVSPTINPARSITL